MTTQAQSPFRLLLTLFRDRFFENDTVTPGGGFQTNIYQVLGVLATIGLLLSYHALPAVSSLSLRATTPQMEWLVRSFRLLFSSYSFGITGFAAIFYWDALFPDRRDFLILAPFPIPLREIIGAKFLALSLFLLMLVGAVNVGPDFMVVMTAIFAPNFLGAGLRITVAQIFATGGASFFAFVAVVALQGILMNVTSAKVFRRISPWVQMCGMSFMVVTLLGFPVYAALLPRAMEQKQIWLYLFPPVWFSGLYEVFLGRQNQLLVSLGTLALKMTALVTLVVLITWGFGFRRHYRRTLESEDAPHRPLAWALPDWLVRHPQERAIFSFIGKTLARSQKHQFFLATYLSAGLCVAAFFGVAIRQGRMALSPGGVRAVAFVVGFFLISGFRAAFQFPAELASNWLFRMTEAKWTELSRSATRKLVLAISLVAALAITLPLEIAVWDWPIVLAHAAVQLVAAALLIEVLFWNFNKVPFTCSYFPGRKSLALLVVLYVYGITGYSFHLADIESAIERRWIVAVIFFGAAAVALVYSWRRRPAATAVRFDGSEPVIQTLELT